MRLRLLALAVLAAAALPFPSAHADPVDDVVDILNQWCDVDLCIPPPIVGDVVWWLVDPAVCPLLSSLSPGVPPVAIEPDGDVVVDGTWVYDCPPYGNPPPSEPNGIDCTLLATLAPGVPGVVDIDPEGDVSVHGEWVYDCPPYDS